MGYIKVAEREKLGQEVVDAMFTVAIGDVRQVYENLVHLGWAPPEPPRPKALLSADLFTKFQISVEGSPESIDVLKSLLINEPLLKSLLVWDTESREYTTKLNYTALKELRNG